MESLRLVPSLESAVEIASKISSNVPPANQFLDLCFLRPSQTLMINFGEKEIERAIIAFFIINEINPEKTNLLIGKISGCSLNKEMKIGFLEEGRLPDPPREIPCAIIGSCRKKSMRVAQAGSLEIMDGIQANLIIRGMNLFLLTNPSTAREFPWVFSATVSDWRVF
jgi:hypothetical protein